MEPKYYADGEDAYAMKRDLTQMADEVSVLWGQGHSLTDEEKQGNAEEALLEVRGSSGCGGSPAGGQGQLWTGVLRR